jgi:hypothetical protein
VIAFPPREALDRRSHGKPIHGLPCLPSRPVYAQHRRISLATAERIAADLVDTIPRTAFKL